MKKAILLVVFLFLIVSQAFAQPMHRMTAGSAGIQHLIIQYGDELNLTDAQKSKLIALQIEHRNQFHPKNRSVMRGDRGYFRNGRNDNRRERRSLRFRKPDRRFWKQRAEIRLEMRQEVLDILTEEQAELLQSRMIEQAKKAHEFRTFRYEYMVSEAGIEDDKAEQVLSLLNAKSANRLELARQRILAPEEVNEDLWTNHFQHMRETDDELRNILTVDEYENLGQNLGFGLGNRHPRNIGRGYRMWSR